MPSCATCGDQGWTVEGHLYDGTAEQVPCPACDEYEVAKRISERLEQMYVTRGRIYEPVNMVDLVRHVLHWATPEAVANTASQEPPR